MRKIPLLFAALAALLAPSSAQAQSVGLTAAKITFGQKRFGAAADVELFQNKGLGAVVDIGSYEEQSNILFLARYHIFRGRRIGFYVQGGIGLLGAKDGDYLGAPTCWWRTETGGAGIEWRIGKRLVFYPMRFDHFFPKEVPERSRLGTGFAIRF